MPATNADHVTPPRSIDMIVGATTAAGLTGVIDLSAYQGRWISIVCDNGTGTEAGFYIQFGNPKNPTSGTAAATSVTPGATEVMFYPRTKDFEIDSATTQCRIIGTAVGFYRITPSSPK